MEPGITAGTDARLREDQTDFGGAVVVVPLMNLFVSVTSCGSVVDRFGARKSNNRIKTAISNMHAMSPVFGRVNIKFGVCIALICITATSTLQTDLLFPKWIRQLPDENQTGVPKSFIQIQNKMLYPTRRLLQNMFSSQSQVDKSRMLQKAQRLLLKSTKPFCNLNGTRSATRPLSVHKLRPGDIDVVGGIGDSHTLGTGSFSFIIPQLVVDYRGSSFTAGGQGTWKEFLTLPNILKVFNPKLIGYAYGDSQAQDSFSQFNVAETGALSRDALFMTKELVKRIKMDKRVNLKEDWKMITMMIGSNTICLELCFIDYANYHEKHREHILSALLYIKENLPRTIVNIVLSPNLETWLKFTNLPPICFFTHIFECPCLNGIQHKDKLKDIFKILARFREVEREIVEMEELKNKEDFTVVLQTFTENLSFPLNRFNSTDTTYLSSDCFHFSQKGYARAANALWNNIMEPVGNKSNNWSKEFDRFVCPTEESPYIRTWKNSMT